MSTDALLVGLSMGLVTVILGLTVKLPVAAEGDADVPPLLSSSIVGGRWGAPPGPIILGGGCCDSVQDGSTIAQAAQAVLARYHQIQC